MKAAMTLTRNRLVATLRWIGMGLAQEAAEPQQAMSPARFERAARRAARMKTTIERGAP
jgi:hypothetical protein